MMVNDISLCAQENGSQREMQDALELASSGIKAYVEEVRLDRIEEALDRLHRGEVSGRLSIVF